MTTPRSKKPYVRMDPADKARMVAGWLDQNKAQDVVALDVRQVCPVSESLVVATAGSARHAKGLADHVLDLAAEQPFEFLGMEGYRDGDWILIDLNDVLVHIFRPEFRQLFDIEGLWSEGKRIELAHA